MLLLLAVVMSGFSSCIRHELSNCVDPRGNVRLTVNLDVKAETGLTKSDLEIENAHIYVFDKNNRLYTSIEGGKYDEDSYECFLNLPDGDYSFVVWTNQGNSYKTNLSQLGANPTIAQLELFLHYNNGTLTENIPDLLHGMNIGTTIIENKNNHVTVSITPITNIINIKVKGLPQTSDNFGFTITDNNSLFNFNSKVAGLNDSFDHVRETRQQNNELNTQIKTLNLDNDQILPFIFKNNDSGEILYSDDLIKMIQRAYGSTKSFATADFSTIRMFNIVLTFDANMDCTVTVNGWDYDPKYQDLE